MDNLGPGALLHWCWGNYGGHKSSHFSVLLRHVPSESLGGSVACNTTRVSYHFSRYLDSTMERLYMEAQDGLKTIVPPLFLNIFFYFLLV